VEQKKPSELAQNGQERPPDAPGRPQTWRAGRIAVKCSAAWATWLGQFAAHCDSSASETVAQALTRYAEWAGYPYPPPQRTTRRRVGDTELPHRVGLARFGPEPAEQGD
jgi:hypothetical protein